MTDQPFAPQEAGVRWIATSTDPAGNVTAIYDVTDVAADVASFDQAFTKINRRTWQDIDGHRVTLSIAGQQRREANGGYDHAAMLPAPALVTAGNPANQCGECGEIHTA